MDFLALGKLIDDAVQDMPTIEAEIKEVEQGIPTIEAAIAAVQAGTIPNLTPADLALISKLVGNTKTLVTESQVLLADVKAVLA